MRRWAHSLIDIVMGALAVTAVALAFQPDSPTSHTAQVAIWAVFLAEYLSRLVLAKVVSRVVLKKEVA